MSTKIATSKNSLLILGLVLVGSVAMADDFQSYIFPARYDSKTNELLTGLDSDVVVKNPEITRQENAQGIEITFAKNKKTILKVTMPFALKTADDDLPDAVQYQGKTSPAITNMSLQVAPQSKAELCEYAKDLTNFQRLLKTKSNRIGFANVGGLGGGGVCWWFSRMERKSAYLTFYSPKKAKPSHAQAVMLLAKIRTGQEIVEIPGYSDFNSFTSDFPKEVQSNLDGWQISDGVFGGGWIHGLEGDSETSPGQLKSIMDATYDNVVRQKKVAYHMLQMPGYAAHAWLVVGMTKTNDGYVLQIVESDYNQQVHLINYKYGMTQFTYEYGDVPLKFVPYLQAAYVREGDGLIKTLRSECAR